MKKEVFDMIIDYSCRVFPEFDKEYNKFNNKLGDDIKCVIERFKSFSFYEKHAKLSIVLNCNKNSTMIECETEKFLFNLIVNTLTSKKLDRLKTNKNEECLVVNFSVSNKTKKQTASLTLKLMKNRNGELILSRVKETSDSETCFEIKRNENNTLVLSFEEIENLFATETSHEKALNLV